MSKQDKQESRLRINRESVWFINGKQASKLRFDRETALGYLVAKFGQPTPEQLKEFETGFACYRH